MFDFCFVVTTWVTTKYQVEFPPGEAGLLLLPYTIICHPEVQGAPRGPLETPQPQNKLGSLSFLNLGELCSEMFVA